MSKNLILFLLVVLFISGNAQVPTLSGYNADPIPTINADDAYELIREWEQLISPDINIPPSVREEEIYNLLVEAEMGHQPIGTYNPNMNIWASGGLQHLMFRLKATKNLNFVEAALYKADALLARRNDTITGQILPTTGKREHTWYGDESNDLNGPVRISYLNVGGIINRIADLSQWILDNPELHEQIAPFNPTIPIDSTVGETYLERAEFYLNEIKKTLDLFDSEGGYWKFNETNNVGFYFNNTLDGMNSLNAYRNANPEEIPLDQFFSVMNDNEWTTTPYNRVLWFCDGYLRTAKALIKLDEVKGTNVYQDFYDIAVDKVESVVNYLLTYGQYHQEESPLNNSLTWPYGSNQNHAERYEDNTHLDMDYEALEYLLDQEVFTDSARTLLASTIFSRYFSYEHHVVYYLMSRQISYDEIFNNPEHGADPYRPRGPAFGTVIGKYGAIEQVQGFLFKSMELLNESVREMRSLNVRWNLMERKDTRRTRWVIYPFQIYQLKKAYHTRIQSSGSNNKPKFDVFPPVSISQDVKLDSVFARVNATDVDPNQQLHYWIAKGNIGARFKINATTGEIRVNKTYPLNADLEDEYQLKVFVTDNGIPAKYDSITATINILKTNSAPVVIPNQHYTASKNMIKGDHVARVKVTDAENDLIQKYVFTTPDDYFRIDVNTGIISLKNANLLSLSSGNVRILYVQVQDAGSPEIFSIMEEVKITIKNRVVAITASDRVGERPLKVDFGSTPVGGDEIYDYEWDFDNDGKIDTTGTTATYTYNKPGVYMATLFVKDNAGLKHAERAMIRVNEKSALETGGLVVHYDFAGDGYTVHDVSGNNYHAKIININNEKNVWISGVVNGGMSFPRGSELEIPKEAFEPIVPARSFTISFWLNDAKLSFNPLFQAYDSDGKHVIDISSHLYADQIRIDVTGINFFENVYQSLGGNANLIRNGWTHWAFVKEASNKRFKVYVNGVKKAQNWAYNNRIKTPKYVRLGALPGIGKDNMTFSIDEFRMYKKALTAEEVEDLYLNPGGRIIVPTSALKPNEQGQAEIYPNPASNVVNINLPQNRKYHTISIIDIDGTLLKKQSTLNQNKVQLSIENIPTGMYLVKLKSDKTTTVSKLIIK